jgi:hypothetical protein
MRDAAPVHRSTLNSAELSSAQRRSPNASFGSWFTIGRRRARSGPVGSRERVAWKRAVKRSSLFWISFRTSVSSRFY